MLTVSAFILSLLALDVQFMLAELSTKDQLQPWCFFLLYINDKNGK
jgi:hypothetical protein